MSDDSRPRRSAVVLAGGFSTRFGEADKAVADLAGTPMIRRTADRVASVVDDLVINCRSAQVDSIRAVLDDDVTFAIDPTPDLGPLGGIRTGLEATDAPVSTVVACDMPFVEPALLEYLCSILETEGLSPTASGDDADIRPDGDSGPDADTRPDAAVPQVEEGWYQTTQAVYRTDAMAEACREALEANEGKILAALDRLEWVVVEEETIRKHATLETFRSIDTQKELEAAEAAFERE